MARKGSGCESSSRLGALFVSCSQASSRRMFGDTSASVFRIIPSQPLALKGSDISCEPNDQGFLCGVESSLLRQSLDWTIANASGLHV